ncbi:MAG: hypothetical protein FWE38_03120 [Firmicutes bacterium]|nr:hypothetical protein [Bacillota bacterium]
MNEDRKRKIRIGFNLRLPLSLILIGGAILGVGGFLLGIGDIVLGIIFLLFGFGICWGGEFLTKEAITDKLNSLKDEVEQASYDGEKIEVVIEKTKMPL